MKQFVPLFLILAVVAGCQAELPPITRVGANSVGALVNKAVWLPQINGLQPNISAVYEESDDLLTVTATNLGDGTYFLWELDPTPIAGTFTVDEWAANGIRFEYGEVSETQGGDPTPYPVESGSGALEISLLDVQNGVFAGEFSFNATTPGGETVEIRDGRFDVRF